MEGTGLLFSPSMLRTVTLPQGQQTIQAPPMRASTRRQRDQRKQTDRYRYPRVFCESRGHPRMKPVVNQILICWN